MIKSNAALICEIGKRLYNKNFVSAHDGNISVLLDDGNILITPTMLSKGFMNPEDMVVIDIDGNIISGGKKPSSEYKMHLEVYKKRPDIKAIVHAHPITATAFAIVGRQVDMKYMPEAVRTLGIIPIAPYAEPSTDDVAVSLRPYIIGHNGALLSNHGAITWGDDLIQAYNFMEQLEFFCEIAVTAERIGSPRDIPVRR